MKYQRFTPSIGYYITNIEFVAKTPFLSLNISVTRIELSLDIELVHVVTLGLLLRISPNFGLDYVGKVFQQIYFIIVKFLFMISFLFLILLHIV